VSSSPVPVSIKPLRNIIGVGTAGSTPGQTGANNVITSVTTNSTTTLVADAVVEEIHDDELVITEHPVEQGSTIADHAYKLPARLELTYAWSAGSNQNTAAGDPLAFLKNLYQQILGFMVNRTLCTVNTGKRIYKSMLVKTARTTSDKENENSLTVRIGLQEILMATTQLVPLTPAAAQAIPQKTAPVTNKGNTQLQPGSQFNGTATP
jgi:hypothetical protein